MVAMIMQMAVTKNRTITMMRDDDYNNTVYCWQQSTMAMLATMRKRAVTTMTATTATLAMMLEMVMAMAMISKPRDRHA